MKESKWRDQERKDRNEGIKKERRKMKESE